MTCWHLEKAENGHFWLFCEGLCFINTCEWSGSGTRSLFQPSNNSCLISAAWIGTKRLKRIEEQKFEIISQLLPLYSVGLPFLKNFKVGYPFTPNFSPRLVSTVASTCDTTMFMEVYENDWKRREFTLANLTGLFSAANCWAALAYSGAKCLQWPHQGAS